MPKLVKPEEAKQGDLLLTWVFAGRPAPSGWTKREDCWVAFKIADGTELSTPAIAAVICHLPGDPLGFPEPNESAFAEHESDECYWCGAIRAWDEAWTCEDDMVAESGEQQT